MDTGTIAPWVKRLGAVGMVTRTGDVADERRVLVTDQIKSACRLTDRDVHMYRLPLSQSVICTAADAMSLLRPCQYDTDCRRTEDASESVSYTRMTAVSPA